MSASCRNHHWVANPGLLDFDDPDPATYACRDCGEGGDDCPTCISSGFVDGDDHDPGGRCLVCDGSGVIPGGKIAVAWARPAEDSGGPPSE